MNIPLDLPPVTPIQVAPKSYIKWKSKVPFWKDFADYLEHGIVISRPDIFAIARVEGDALFVRVAVGDLGVLLNNLPARLPRIRFYRRNGEREKEYDLEKFLHTADKMKKKVED